MTEILIPIGNKQRAPASAATDAQLKQFLDWFATIENSEQGQKYVPQAAAASAEQDRRASTGLATRPTPPAEPLTGLAKLADPDEVTARLQAVAAHYHLVSPATQVDNMPVGFGVSVATVLVNPDPHAGEVYRVDGKLALSGCKLMEIAAAANVSWDPDRGGRVDDGSDPRYVRFVAVGRVRNFDNTWRTISGQVEADYRDGSDLARNCSPAQLAQERKFILPKAESKARNRAVASGFGIARSYPPNELHKPFAIASLIYTGHSDDPVLARELALMAAQAALGATVDLYGTRPPPPVARALESTTVEAPADPAEEWQR